MKVCFYKGTHKGLSGVYNRLVRWWCKGKYSHVEAYFSDGMSASSSYMDGGVRFKLIDYKPENWDIIEIPDHLEERIYKWYDDHKGDKYDLMGNLHFVISAVKDSSDKWSCAESFAESIGLKDSWRFEPNILYSVLTSIYQQGTKNA